jgi:2-polyprenyl-6-methoxyphenol hydroxylase-like FAD-dependent oxidoreductase
MARVVVVGGGVVGLCGALLLGLDGHEVTVLERDPAPAPEPDAAWTGWDRRGVNQFRMLHIFQPRFRQLMADNAPEVVRALVDAGALRMNPFRDLHPLLTGGFRDADARYDTLTARRPLMEATIARIVETAEHVTVRRGVVVVGLVTGDPVSNGIPHVIGVHTDRGEVVLGDIVIEAGGRRSMLPSFLEKIGARSPIEEKEDCGFVYYARHFRSDDGSVPRPAGPLEMAYDSVSLLTLPADNGTWGVGVVTSAKDVTLRSLKDVDVWTRVVRSYPLAAHWLDGEPFEDGIAVMAKIEDRHRTFVIDGQPIATGVLALSDSWACSNPSSGRGITLGAIHAVALRDLLHDAPDDPVDLACRWHDATMATVEPWYRDTLAYDDGRLEHIHAEIDGREFEPSPEYDITEALQVAASKDPEMLRCGLEISGVLTLRDEVLARPGVLERILELGGGWRDRRLPGLTRPELLSIVAA